MLIPQTSFIPAPNLCSHIPATVVRALLSQGFLGSSGAPRPFPLGFFGGLCLKFKGNSTNNPTLLQPEAAPRLGRGLGIPPLLPVTGNEGQSPGHFPAQPQPSEEFPGVLHEENSLHFIQTLQSEGPAAGTGCSMDLLKMKEQCLVLRVGGNHGQGAAPRGGDTARHQGHS